MASKIPVDKLSDEIKNILLEYSGNLQRNINEITPRVGEAGVKALRQESKKAFYRTGNYSKGWKLKIAKSNGRVTAIIHNAKAPGLPHLLEYGHANRDGGRTPGKIHIKLVEEQIIKNFEDAVKVEI